MKIQNFKIDSFARPELTSGGPIELQDIDGNDALIRGANQTGKTHTFNAVLYSLLGETIALQRGHGNAVELNLSGGFEIFRGEQGKRVFSNGDEFGPDRAESIIQEKVGSRDLLHTHFLHSRVSELPLERLPQSKRASRILSATSDDLNEIISNLESQIDTLEDKKERKEAEESSEERELQRLKRRLSNVRTEFEKWSKVEELAESGRLKEISEALKQAPELEEQISDLNSKRRSLITDIREKQNEKTRAEELKEETREIIIKSLEEFICPVCEERVNRSEASSRLDDDYCPFCNQSTDIRATFDHLESEKEQSEGTIENINQELDQLKSQKETVDQEIESLKEDRPEIADLNSYAIDQLKDYDHDLEEIQVRAREKRVEAEGYVDEYEERVHEAEKNISETRDTISELEDEQDSKRSKVQELKTEDVSKRISNFEEVWNHHYQKIVPQIADEIHINRDGVVALTNDDGRRREYDRRGDLADAEVVLLNVSFAIALNRVAIERGSINWETIVLDEPFARLDRGLKEDAIDHLRDLEIQFIITSSDELVWDEFSPESTLILERQAKLTEF